MKKLYPYYYQADEDAEPEFIGYCATWDEAAERLGSERIYEMSVVDIADDDIMDGFVKNHELDKDDLEKYLAERRIK